MYSIAVWAYNVWYRPLFLRYHITAIGGFYCLLFYYVRVLNVWSRFFRIVINRRSSGGILWNIYPSIATGAISMLVSRSRLVRWDPSSKYVGRAIKYLHLPVYVHIHTGTGVDWLKYGASFLRVNPCCWLVPKTLNSWPPNPESENMGDGNLGLDVFPTF